MSMCHKAFVFEWPAFEQKLAPILFSSLSRNDRSELLQFIRANRATCKDPYEGEPLGPNWEEQLTTAGVQEAGDFALTCFYNPADDFGLHEEWLTVEATLPEGARIALLGFPFGPTSKLFDPGLMGTYFQSPAQVVASARHLAGHVHPDLMPFIQGINSAAAAHMGLLVVF
jgi:hypothetical protein